MQQNSPLIHWQYNSEDWDTFVTLEKQNKKEDNLYFGVGILIIATAGLMFFRNTSFVMALAFSVPLAILIPWLRLQFSYKHLKKGIAAPEVKVFADHIKFNTHIIELQSKQRRVKNLKIVEANNGFQLLEFDVQWLTRKGPTNDEFRILIPFEKIMEAQRLVQQFQSNLL